MGRLGIFDLLRINSRLVLLQSTWCEGGMQSIGLTYCLVPGLKSLCETDADLKAAIEKHREPFNTHPFLASVAVGAALRMEEEGRAPQEIVGLLRSTMGPLAALGDPFFRSALPAFSVTVAVLLAMLVSPLAGVLSAMLLFNSVHLFVRVSGLVAGYRDGYTVVGRVARWLSPSRTSLLKAVAGGVAGSGLAAALVRFPLSSQPVTVLVAIVAVTVAAAVGLKLYRSAQPFAVPVVLAVVVIVEVMI